MATISPITPYSAQTSVQLNEAVAELTARADSAVAKANELAVLARYQAFWLSQRALAIANHRTSVSPVVADGTVVLDMKALPSSVALGGTALTIVPYGLAIPASSVSQNQFALQSRTGEALIPSGFLLEIGTGAEEDSAPAAWVTASDSTVNPLSSAVDARPETAWHLPLDAEETDVWLRVTFPTASMTSPTTNLLTALLDPLLGLFLIEASALCDGTYMDLLDGSIAGHGWEGEAPRIGPLAFCLPGSPVVTQWQLRVRRAPGFADDDWLFSIVHLGAYACTWASQLTVTLDVTDHPVLGSAPLASATANAAWPEAQRPVTSIDGTLLTATLPSTPVPLSHLSITVTEEPS